MSNLLGIHPYRALNHLRAPHVTPRSRPSKQDINMPEPDVTVCPYTTVKCLDLSGEIVTVLVGKSEQSFAIHKQLLIGNSTFARGALSSEWPSGMNNIIRLPEHEPETFQMYSEYLYTGNIRYLNRKLPDGHSWERPGRTLLRLPREAKEQWYLLIDSYVFGDYMGDTRFQNIVMDSFIEKHHGLRTIPNGYATEVYGSTLQNNPLRKLLVDFHVYHNHGTLIIATKHEGDSRHAPSQFLRDVIREFNVAGKKLYIQKEQMPWDQDPCRYHIHERPVTKTVKRKRAAITSIDDRDDE